MGRSFEADASGWGVAVVFVLAILALAAWIWGLGSVKETGQSRLAAL